MEAVTQLPSIKDLLWRGIISKSFLILAIVIFVSFKTIAEQPQAVSIGNISDLSGYGQIRTEELKQEATLNLPVKNNDEAITANGRMALTFLDESVVTLTEHSQLVIDEYIYDPDPSKSKMALTFTLGTARFLSGNVNRMQKQNISLSTPTAQIAIRGSNFSVTINEIGETLVVNLPYGPLGLDIGEIEVITAMGSVILTQPFEATTVSVYEKAPSKSVILDLTLDQIDNYLIVSPPKEKFVLVEETQVNQSDILDFNELDIDFLDSEDLLEDELDEFSELDIDYLASDTNFLSDLLDVLSELDVREEEDALAENVGGVSLKGTSFGQDLDTGIITFMTGEILTLQREAANARAKVDIDGAGSYTIILIQDGKSQTIYVNGGSDSKITITQSDG